MKYEVSERIRTPKSEEELLELLESKFKKVSESVQRSGQKIVAKSIDASFGSINRKDETIVSLRKQDDGWLIVADVNYRPSVAFWIILIVTIFTYVFWLIPITFYLLQKKTVKEGIEECFQHVKNELHQPTGETIQSSGGSMGDLEKLAALKERGLVTEDEFEAKKKQILGL